MGGVFFRKTHQRAFGTWPLKGAELRSALAAAFAVGYRTIDTAQMYGNEADVGQAIAAAPVPRSELLIATKVHPDAMTDARFLPSVRASLAALGLERVDVLYIHWPPVGGDVAPGVRLLESAVREGLADHIAVSNFTARMMREARGAATIPIAANQVEFHPLLDQSKLLAAATETGIPLASYCSVARGEIFKYPLFAEIGVDYGKSAAQVALRWILQTGVSINTMSTKPENIAANFDVMDFTLSSVDMDRIDAMTKTGFRVVDARNVPWAPDWD
jgi:2,5-diketo-D-gluconate reductase B